MKSFIKLFEILGKWKIHYLMSAIFLLFSVAFRVFEPKVLQFTVDKVITPAITGIKSIESDTLSNLFYFLLPDIGKNSLSLILIYLGVIFLVISLFRGLFMFISGTMTASSTEKAIKKLRDNLFRHIQFLPLAYHSKTPTGELIQRCTGDVETVRKFASMHVVEIIRMITLFLFAFAMMYIIYPPYAFIAVALVPIISLGSYFFFKRESKVWDEHEKQQDKLTALVQENLSGIRVVKAFAKEDFEIEKFTAQNQNKKLWGIKLMRLHSIFWPSSDFIVHLQVAVSIFAGAYFTLNGMISIGQLVASYSYATLVTWPLRRLGQVISEMGMTSVALARIYSILETKKEEQGKYKIAAPSIKGDIEFENVSFRYDKNSEVSVLENISFKINAGEKTALIGPAGSGKTTLISLLMRFYEPDSGIIRLDGKNIKEYSKSFLRERIGLVLQRPFLFSTTIRDNIAYGDPDSHIEEVIDSAKAANVHEIIEDVFPSSYETVLGEKGVTLSGGQKQRVTIARTLLTSPDIMILDDSTSSVDTETEFGIQNALNKILKNNTVLVIAHRITSVQDCSKIIVLDKGRITEIGTHEELLKHNGFYKKVFDIQLSVEEEINNEIKGSTKVHDDSMLPKRKLKSNNVTVK